MLTIQEAAERTGVSPKTIRRRLDELSQHGAKRDGDTATAPWLIPVEALEAVGLSVGEQAPVVDIGQQLADALHAIELERLRAEQLDADTERVTRERDRARSDLEQESTAREQAERQVIEQRGRADVAEAQAIERDRTIELLQADIERERAAVEAARAEQAETQKQLQAVQGSLGWLARRRAAKSMNQ